MVSRSLIVFVSACVLAVASASVTNRIEDNFRESKAYDSPKTNEVEEESSWWTFPTKQINMIQRMLSDCGSGDPFSVCLKAKAVTFLDRVLRKDNIHVMEGLSLVADANNSRSRAGRALTEEELVASLPRELGKKEETLDQMIVGKLTEFFQSHKVKLDFSEDNSSDVAEARGKGKKYLPILLLGKFVAATHMGLALKGLALLAIKALVVAKVALAIAGLIAIKKLFSHEKHHTYEVIAEHSDHHDRVYNEPYGAQLAYRAYVPNQS